MQVPALMDASLFAQLAESMEQMGEITRGERAPSREFHVDALKVKQVRAVTGLSQAEAGCAFAFAGDSGTL
jgi:putative transcriptional regulator